MVGWLGGWLDGWLGGCLAGYCFDGHGRQREHAEGFVVAEEHAETLAERLVGRVLGWL